jgi:LPS-assembly protein
MKNKILTFILLIVFFFNQANSQEIFNFDVTEVEILNDGNIFKGLKRGIASTEDGVFIEADNFKYDKLKNILYANGNVIIDDTLNKTKIFSDDITYLKNEEIIFTSSRSKAINETTSIDGDKFEYNKKLNIIKANGNVIINNKIKDYKLFTEKITHEVFKKKFLTNGYTKAIIQSKYNFESKNVLFLEDEMKLSSSEKSTVKDNDSNFYKLDEFEYSLNSKILKGKNILLITNHLKPKSDKTYFTDGIFNFSNNEFASKNTKILFHKELFDKERIINKDQKDLEKYKNERFKGKNDPRIYGISSTGNKDKTFINKGVFTSCKKNDNCPPWSINAETITHDKIKKNIIYKNAFLNVYDFPVFYFPKFFHPDPSVKKRSGLLQPRLNSSSIVGTSINQPYYHVISENKDFTFKPTIFDNRIYMFQNEYRQENKNSSFIADFAYTKGYKSKSSNNRNGMSHLFSKYDLDLGLKDFSNSKLNILVEKVSMDTYLKIFENAILTDETFKSNLKDHNTMETSVKLSLDHDNYNLTSGFTSYEKLQTLKNSDRYQYIFPYYDFSTSLFSNESGELSFTSNGNNSLKDTNNLKTVVTNNFQYKSLDTYSKTGFVSNFGIHLKNLNSIAKNDSKYKSSPQSKFLNINEFSLSYPLIKNNNNNYDYLIPKISFRINPSNMKNYSSDSRLITTDNVFSVNRLGLSETYESGKSLTLGLDYKKEDMSNNEKFLEVKLAGVMRDAPEYKIPQSSSLQGQTSNLIGSIENKFSKHLAFNYDFSLDNNLQTFEYNNFKTEFKVNNFVTEFGFHESNGKIGDSNFLSNETSISFDDNNYLKFKTRRNRKISLTEYYDFVYEYQNDCLTAALKYKKTYYQDRDALPKEDLFFTITLFPLTTIDQKIDKKLYRDDNNDIIWK